MNAEDKNGAIPPDKQSSPTTSDKSAETTSPTSPLDQPRVDLLSLDPSTMNDQQLAEFVRLVRSRRTSQQLANENKPQRRGTSDAPSATRRAETLNDLLA